MLAYRDKSNKIQGVSFPNAAMNHEGELGTVTKQGLGENAKFQREERG
jgi:hypothetical protein